MGKIISSSGHTVFGDDGREWIRLVSQEEDNGVEQWTSKTKKDGTQKLYPLILHPSMTTNNNNNHNQQNDQRRLNNNKRIKLIMVRHGERVDETEQAYEFNKNCNGRIWDPWLTNKGKEQARSAGMELRMHHHLPEILLTSPTLRTIQTAAEISSFLDGIPVLPVPGLAQCAAMVCSRGIKSFKKPKDKTKGFLSTEEMRQNIDPLMNTEILETENVYDNFIPCLRRILSKKAASVAETDDFDDEKPVVVVTHREGFRELYELVDMPIRRVKYCEIDHFEYDPRLDEFFSC